MNPIEVLAQKWISMVNGVLSLLQTIEHWRDEEGGFETQSVVGLTAHYDAPNAWVDKDGNIRETSSPEAVTPAYLYHENVIKTATGSETGRKLALTKTLSAMGRDLTKVIAMGEKAHQLVKRVNDFQVFLGDNWYDAEDKNVALGIVFNRYMAHNDIPSIASLLERLAGHMMVQELLREDLKDIPDGEKPVALGISDILWDMLDSMGEKPIYYDPEFASLVEDCDFEAPDDAGV